MASVMVRNGSRCGKWTVSKVLYLQRPQKKRGHSSNQVKYETHRNTGGVPSVAVPAVGMVVPEACNKIDIFSRVMAYSCSNNGSSEQGWSMALSTSTLHGLR